jgi:hypothetical protein
VVVPPVLATTLIVDDAKPPVPTVTVMVDAKFARGTCISLYAPPPPPGEAFAIPDLADPPPAPHKRINAQVLPEGFVQVPVEAKFWMSAPPATAAVLCVVASLNVITVPLTVIAMISP